MVFRVVMQCVIGVMFSSVCFANNLADFELKLPYLAPEIEFTDSDGVSHTLKEFRGKVVLLNFWATWCKPCVEEMPALSRLQQSLKDEQVMVLPLSLDMKGGEAVKEFYSQQGIANLPVFVDQRFVTYSAFGTRVLPSSYVIDSQGNVVVSFRGAYEWDSEQVKTYLLGVR